MLKLTNVVVRDVRDRDGFKLGRVVEPHDGTEAGIVTADEQPRRECLLSTPRHRTSKSRICATDARGKIRWAVSPNFLHVADGGTDEASYIWGDPALAKPLDSTHC